MNKSYKLVIYKGIMQYLVGSTNYNLKNIAELTSSSIKQVRGVYHGQEVLSHDAEIKLLMLYQFILELQFKGSYENS